MPGPGRAGPGRQATSWPERRPGRQATSGRNGGRALPGYPAAVRIAVLVKQVPAVESMELAAGGRLQRHGVPLEMNAFCRRAVSKGVELAGATGGSCTVVTVGPPSAEDVLREAVACGADRGVLVSDPVMAGADTLATARAVVAALHLLGPFDLVLAGRSSVDADTGQVGPEVAELLGLPFVGAARELATVDGGGSLEVRCERDEGWRRVRVALPAVVSTAERLTEPCKRPPEACRAVPADRLQRLTAADLGPGPWGAEGSPTTVGAVRAIAVDRAGTVLAGPPDEQARRAVALLAERGSIPVPGHPPVAQPPLDGPGSAADPVPDASGPAAGDGTAAGGGRPVVAVVVEPAAPTTARELLGEAACLAAAHGGRVVAVGPDPGDPGELAGWGADEVVTVTGAEMEEDVAAALAGAWAAAPPWAALVPGTAWGREVAGRVAARLGAGLTGDAVGLGSADGRVVWVKPAFGGQLVVDVTAAGLPQMGTVRPGILPRRRPRAVPGPVPQATLAGSRAGRVTVTGVARDDEVAVLAAAPAVVVVGQGVDPADYPLLDPLLRRLGAVLGATRKVTDRGWLPRSRQIGITGHSVAPALLVLVGVGGSVNHMVSSRGAGTIVAVNHDPEAAVFRWVDVGLVGDWRQVVPALVGALDGAPVPGGARP